MIPELFRRQLEDGCWGITTANAQQTRVAHAAGVPRVLIANELVGRADIDAVLAELRADEGFSVGCYVDSVAGVERLAARIAADPPPRPLDVLLETGYAGGRCGVRSVADALAVARAAAAAPGLRLAGVATYEGLLQTHAPDVRDDEAAAVLALARRGRARVRCRRPAGRGRSGAPERRRQQLLRPRRAGAGGRGARAPRHGS